MIRPSLTMSPVTLPGQRTFETGPFPLVLQCETEGAEQEDVQAWVRANREALDAQAAVHGAVLFRGLPLSSPQDFDAFVAAFDFPNFPYSESLSNAVRINYTERVFSANEAPPDVTIYLHHEMAQTPIYPSKLFFYCQKAADEGGATPVCRSDALYARIERELPGFARACEEKGLKYTNIMPPENDFASGMGRSWRSTLRAESREEAEARLARLGYSWEWREDGCLRATTPVLPAVRRLPDGRKSFFNQLIAAHQGWKDARNDPSKAITHGDGAPLDAEAVRRVVELAGEFTADIPWRPGDVALLDNYVVMHGRRTFRGTRQVLASLVGATSERGDDDAP